MFGILKVLAKAVYKAVLYIAKVAIIWTKWAAKHTAAGLLIGAAAVFVVAPWLKAQKWTGAGALSRLVDGLGWSGMAGAALGAIAGAGVGFVGGIYHWITRYAVPGVRDFLGQTGVTEVVF